MKDPKQTLEKLTKYAKNADFAKHSETLEQTEHLANIAENVKPIAKVGSFVQHFLDEVTPKRGVDYLPKEEMEEIKKELTPIKGKDYFTDEEKNELLEKATPKFGQDYFTPEHIEQIKDEIREGVKPVKGVDYDDGTNGIDADEDRIIEAVLEKIPKLENGKDGKDAEPLKMEDIVSQTIRHLGSLKGDKRISLRSFKEGDDVVGKVALHSNMMKNMPQSLIDGDQRWGGHGVKLNAGSNVTIVNNSDGSYTITSTGGGGGGGTSIAIESFAPNLTNTYTFVNTPLWIYVGGQELTNGNGYTLTGNVAVFDNVPLNQVDSVYSPSSIVAVESIAVNGTNSYTFTHTPIFIFVGGQELTNGNGYTLTGMTAVFDNIPLNQVDSVYNTSGASGTSGITRIISSVSIATAAGAVALTDYAYLVAGNTTITLPTAVGNTNRYTIKNVGTGTVTVATTSAQTIDANSTITIPVQYQSQELISDNSNWNLI